LGFDISDGKQLMPTKYYFQNAAAAITPTGTFFPWNSTTGTVFAAMGTTKSGAATTKAVSETSAVGGFSARALVFVGPPTITDGAVDGPITVIMGTRETTAGNLYFFAYVGLIRSGSLISGGDYNIVSNTATATGRQLDIAMSSPISSLAGDRIAVEIGLYTSNTTTTSQTLTLNYGATGATDLTAGSTAVTTNPGYILFSSANVDALFLPPAVDPGRGLFATC
jgi:hypothetical protein